MIHATCRRITAVSVIALAVFLALVWVPWLIQGEIATGANRRSEWIFWLQTFSGNWSPTDSPPVSRWAFAFSAVVAVVTNNAIGALVVGLIWRLLSEWRKRMKLAQILMSREQVTREALYHAFPTERARVKKALSAAKDDWYPELVALVGETAASGILQSMDKEI